MLLNNNERIQEKNNIITMKNNLKKLDFSNMITIKFMVHQNDEEIIRNFNKIIRTANKYIYGTDRKKGKHHLGIVVLEKNTIKSPNKFHIHMLLKNDNKMSKLSDSQLLDIYIKSSERIKNELGYSLFDHKNIETVINSDGVSGVTTGIIHVEKLYNERGVDYALKNINMSCDNLLFLEKHGINYGDIKFSVLNN
jgi:hypothetical protein